MAARRIPDPKVGGSTPSALNFVAIYTRVDKKMRGPGIEPGSTAWKATMLTITPATQRYNRQRTHHILSFPVALFLTVFASNSSWGGQECVFSREQTTAVKSSDWESPGCRTFLRRHESTLTVHQKHQTSGGTLNFSAELSHSFDETGLLHCTKKFNGQKQLNPDYLLTHHHFI